MSLVIEMNAFPAVLKDWAASNKLWAIGNVDLLSRPMASVIGTREASPEGIRRTRRITRLLVSQGFCVVSGLASGIDAAAHREALESNGSTIAVMGTPIEDCYPKENSELKVEIAARGLVLSQFEPGSSVHRGNFPRRNILMASLSSITFVVEADLNSGTRHQVKAATKLRRPVAFLASLAARNYPWVREALECGVGLVIERPEDALTVLEHILSSHRHEDSIKEEDRLLFKDDGTGQSSIESPEPTEAPKVTGDAPIPTAKDPEPTEAPKVTDDAPIPTAKDPEPTEAPKVTDDAPIPTTKDPEPTEAPKVTDDAPIPTTLEFDFAKNLR